MTARLITCLALLAPLSLVGVALLASRERGRNPTRLERALGAATALGLAVSFVEVAWLVLGHLTSGGAVQKLGLIRLDGLSVTMAAMVSLLVAVVGRYSATYLDGDQRHGEFLGRLAAAGAAVELLVVSNHLLLFWIAWVATSLCLHRLLLFHPERPRAVVAARKKFIVARIGDLLLAAAFVLIWRRLGTADMSELLSRSGSEELVGVLIACAALLKSAQFPTHGWLLEVMETPTPVSALLHAGILNAGPFLVLRFAPLFVESRAPAAILVVAGGFTAVFASSAMLTQPSVKVALGYSSAAHMGFMLFVCGLGVFPAAALHLVAHSFYKAHAFLSAGSTVEATLAARIRAPERRGSPRRAAVSFLVAGATYVGVAHVLGMSPWENPSLVVVGAVVVMGLAQLFATGLADGGRLVPLPSSTSEARRRLRQRGAPATNWRNRRGTIDSVPLRVAALAAFVALAFFGLEELTRRALAGALPPLVDPPPSILMLGVSVVMVWGLAAWMQMVGLGGSSPRMARLRVHLRHGFYANALFDRIVGSIQANPPFTSHRGTRS
ncbi:MAG: proton-conducting transporter membrane subunit [Polyangiaceae bacterium]